MRVHGTFTTKNFKPTSVSPTPAIFTALPTSVATMEKVFTGQISGRSATLFTSAFDPAKGSGSYIAMECFEGELNGRRGTFSFVHAASTKGKNRENEFFSIVDGSGSGSLVGIRGTGGMKIDDGTHQIWFDAEGLD